MSDIYKNQSKVSISVDLRSSNMSWHVLLRSFTMYDRQNSDRLSELIDTIDTIRREEELKRWRWKTGAPVTGSSDWRPFLQLEEVEEGRDH